MITMITMITIVMVIIELAVPHFYQKNVCLFIPSVKPSISLFGLPQRHQPTWTSNVSDTMSRGHQQMITHTLSFAYVYRYMDFFSDASLSRQGGAYTLRVTDLQGSE